MENMQVEEVVPTAVEEVVPPTPIEEVVPPQPVEEVVAPQPVEEVVAPQPVEEVVAPQPVEELILQFPKRVKRDVISSTVASFDIHFHVTFPADLPGALDGQEFLCYTNDRRWVSFYTLNQKLYCEEGDVRMWKNKIYYFV